MKNTNLQSSVEIVQGQRGAGKTNHLKSRFLEITPLYIVDIRNEYKHIPAFASLQSFLYYILGNRDTKYVRYPIERIGEYREEQFRFAFSSKKELIRLFAIFRNFRNCTIAIDEADALFSDRQFQQALTDVFLGSRNNNVSMIFVGKRPFLIPILIRSQVDRFTVFRTEEERDIQYLEGRVRAAFPKQPFKLERGEAIIIEQGEVPKLVHFEKFKGD